MPEKLIASLHVERGIVMRGKELHKCYYDVLLPLYGDREANWCAKLLLEELYGLHYTDYDHEVEPVGGVIERLKAEQPIQQIIGHAWFYDHKFKVNEHTLIPRNETEELVDWIIKDYRQHGGLSVLDIGTGSGVIAVTLALNLPAAEVTALDFSSGALSVAKHNNDVLGSNVRFVRQDILTTSIDGEYDVIVSNPPYITKKEISLMRNNVLNFEPHTALFVEDNDPLLFYRRIAELARSHLRNGGALYFEINENYGRECCELLSELGFINIVLRKDLNSKDRMIKTTISSK